VIGLGGFGGLGDIVAHIGISGDKQFISKMRAMDTQTAATAKIMNKALTVSFLAATAAIIASFTAAAQFESSFAGVVKTVDGLDDGMGNLNQTGKELAQGFRDLSFEIPVSVNELNKIGELGGQLGIAKEELLSFTETIAKIATTTDLTIEAASMDMAKFVNVTKQVAPAGMLASEQIERMGSTIVELGNNTATTESAILAMATRIAGVGNIIGLTQPEILGISAAMSAVGINAQAGGTAMSRAMTMMATAVEMGGGEIELFAEVSKLSVDEFSRLFKDDAAAAISAFLVGLGEIKEDGGNTFKTIDELGFSNIRLQTAMLKGASASDLFTKSLAMAKAEYELNTALNIEFNKRASTLISTLKMLGNVLYDAFIEVGNKYLPALKDFLNNLKENPEAIRDVVTNLVPLIVKIGLAAGAIKLWISVSKTWIALGLPVSILALKTAFASLTTFIVANTALLAPLVILLLAAGAAMIVVNLAANDAYKSMALLNAAIKVQQGLVDENRMRLEKMVGIYEELGEHAADDMVRLNDVEMTVAEATEKINEQLVLMKENGKGIADIELTFDKIVTVGGELFNVTEALADSGITLTSSVQKQIVELEKLYPFIKDDALATSELTEKIKELKERIMPASDATKILKERMGEFKAIIPDIKIGVSDASIEMYILADNTKALADKTKEAADAAEAAAEAIKKEKEQAIGAAYALGDLWDAFGDGDRVISNLMTAFEKLISGDYIGAVIAGLKLLWEAISSDDKISKVEEFEAAGIKMNAAVYGEIQALAALATSYNLTDAEIEQVINKLDALFESIGKVNFLIDQETIDIYNSWVTALGSAGAWLAELQIQIEGMYLLDGIFSQAELQAMWDYSSAGLSVAEQLEKIQELLLAGGPPEWLAFLQEQYNLLIDTTEALVDQEGAVNGLVIAWEKYYSVLFEEFSTFEQNVQTATQGIQDLLYFNIDLDTTDADEQIWASMLAMQAYLRTLDPNSQAYRDGYKALQDLWLLYDQLGTGRTLDISFPVDLDQLDNFTRVTGEMSDALGDASDQAERLAAEFAELEGKVIIINDYINYLNAELDILYAQRDRVIEIKNSIAEISEVIELLNGDDVNFYQIDKILTDLGLKLDAFVIQWSAAFGQMLTDYEQFGLDMAAADAAIQLLMDFNVDLDTTDADEQINALIFKWLAYLDTLDPGSAAYTRAKKMIDDLIARFEELGGTLSEEDAIAFNTALAQAAIDELEAELNGLPTEFELNMAIQETLDKIAELLALLNKILLRMLEIAGMELDIEIPPPADPWWDEPIDLKINMPDIPIIPPADKPWWMDEIELNVKPPDIPIPPPTDPWWDEQILLEFEVDIGPRPSDAWWNEPITIDLYYNIKTIGTPPTGGEYPTAHSGYSGAGIGREIPALIKDNEAILTPALTSNIGTDNIAAANKSGNPASLGGTPVNVEIHEATPSTWVSINDQYLQPRNKETDNYTITRSIF